MFFALCEVSVSLNAHDAWLKTLPDHQWGGSKQTVFLAVYYLGFVSAGSFLLLGIVMIVFMRAVVPEEVATAGRVLCKRSSLFFYVCTRALTRSFGSSTPHPAKPPSH